MYYVMQVTPGKEAETEKYISERISSECYSSCFYPVRHVKKKFHGEWQDKHEKLLPGYVFINSKDIYRFYLELKNIPMLTRLLGQDREFVVALTKEEAAWLEKLVPIGLDGTVKAEIPLSIVEIDEKNEVRILCGPLKDVEGLVRRINLHKRIAEVEVRLMGRSTVIYMGIEMIRKR